MTENNNDDEKVTKEDLIEKIEALEKKIMNKLNAKETEIKDELTNLKEKSTSILQKSEILLNNYSNDKLRDTKIADFETFKNKVNDMMISHDIRINNNIRDISNLTSKYDKMFTENIFVPGFVGPSCQYKSLSDYISFNINEVSRLKVEKDEIKKEQKEYRAKMDHFMKQMLVLNESAVVRSREYTNGKQKDFEALIGTKLEPLNDKIFRFYELSSKFQSKAEKEINNFRDDIKRILKIKEELIEIMNERENKIKMELDELNKKIISNIQDIGMNKNKISGLKDKLNKINNNFSKLNIDLNALKRELKKNNNININSSSTDIRYNVADFSSSFVNNPDKNDLIITRSNYKNKTTIFNGNEKVTEREEKDEEDGRKNINNEENIKINDNEKNDPKNLDEIIKKNLQRHKTEFQYKLEKDKDKEKDKYKLHYNKIMKETPEDITFETFYLGKSKIPIITKPFLLDQRILSDEEMNRIYKEKKKEKRKEKIRLEKIRKSFFKHDLNSMKNKININDISNNMKRKNFDINYYKLSIPKSTPNKKSEEKVFNLTNYQNKKMKEINNEIKFNNILSNEKAHFKLNSNSNNMKYLNFINLRLDNSVAINPDTNNGAYILAKKQLENNKMSRINVTPTSYMHFNDYSNGKKTSKLVSMTFMKEEQKMMNSFNNTLENEENRMKLEVSDLYKNVKFFTKN